MCFTGLRSNAKELTGTPELGKGWHSLLRDLSQGVNWILPEVNNSFLVLSSYLVRLVQALFVIKVQSSWYHQRVNLRSDYSHF